MNSYLRGLALAMAGAMALASVAIAGTAIDSLTTADGKRYRDVKWGPVNKGKVVMFHTRGVAIVPVSDLPEEFWGQFGYKPGAPKQDNSSSKPRPSKDHNPVPPPEPAPIVKENPDAPTKVDPPPPPLPSLAEMQAELEKMRARDRQTSPELKHWKQYNNERASVLLFGGKLVDRNALSAITGFVVDSRLHVQADSKEHRATVIELAVRRTDTKEVADSMSLRPALWRSTGEQVLLLDYEPEGDMAGVLIRVYGKESGTHEERRCFNVGIEPSFKEWLALRKPN